jgi:hypothetical protein
MATSEQVAPLTVAAPSSSVLRAVQTVAATLLGVTLALAFYSYRKVSSAFFGAATATLKRCGLPPLIRRFPTLTAGLGLAGAIASAPFGDRLFSGARPDLRALAGLAVFWISTGLYLFGGDVISTPPMRFDGLREAIARRFPERWFQHQLSHPLDAYFVRVTLNDAFLVLPVLVAIALRPAPSPLLMALYLVTLRVVGLIHEAMDHGNIHNHLFRPKRGASPFAALLCRAVGMFQEYPLNLAVGRIPGWYRVQHVAVHHGEDGGLDDNQTTVPRDRTSFLQYGASITSWLLSRFFAVDVALYLMAHGHRKMLRSLVLHVAGYYLALALLAKLCWPVVLCLVFARIFTTPDSVVTHYNWHGFVDARDFANPYLNTVHVEGKMEHGFLGLNAHLHHHLHAACHWSDLAPEARREEARYRAEGVVVLRANGRERTQLLKLLFERRFTDLGEEMAAIGDAPREDFARILEERSQPLWPRRWPRALDQLDRALSVTVARLLL